MKLIINLIFALLPIFAFSQSPHVEQYTDKEGLPGMVVYQVLQDDNGLIWITTDNGIAYFDGQQFTKVTHPKMEGQDFVGLYKAPTGRIWFWNWSGQVFYLNKNKLEYYSPDGFLDSLPMSSLFSDDEGNIFLIKKTHNNQLIYCDNKGNCLQKRYITDQYFLDSSSQFRTNKHNKMPFFWTESFLDFLTFPTMTQSFISYNTHLGVILVNKKVPNILYQLSYKNQEIIQKEILRIGANKAIRDVYYDNNENIWVLTNSGTYLFDKNKISKPHNIPLVDKALINCIIQDKNDGYWLATNGEGLFYIPNRNYITVTEENSILSSDNIISIISDTHKTIIATKTGDIIVINSNPHEIKEFPFKKSIQYFHKRTNNKGFFITSNNLTYEVDNNFHRKKEYSWRTPKSILEVNDTIYLATATNILIIYKDSIGNFPEALTTADRYQNKHWDIGIAGSYYSVLKRNNKIYLGTLKGGVTYHNNIWEKINFSKYPTLNKALIQDIKVDNDNNIIWFATSQGLHGLKNDTLFQSFTVENGLSDNNCNHIQFDSKNQIWVGTYQGVNIINPLSKEVSIISSSDGLPSNRITSLSLNNTQAWVGTPRGVAYFNQDEVLKKKPLFPVSITNIEVDRKDTILLEEYILNYEDNNCVISFVSPSFDREELTYHYRLVGLNSDWISTNSTTIPYTSLPSGTYQFEVYATNLQGVKSTINRDIRLTILKPFWEKWWFIFIGVVLAMAVAALVTYLIARNYRKRREEKLNFQRELSESKIKALQAQMNPHFIFNALNAIQFFFTTNSKELAMLHLNKFAKLIRLIFEYSKETTITLLEETKFLQLYLELEKLRFNKKIDFEYQIDKNLEMEVSIPPLLIQPIIENSFKHGLLHKEGKGRLKVLFQQKTPSIIICVIEDDGIGRTAAKQYRKKWTIEGYRSSGVDTVEERIKLFNQNDNPVIIKMDIIDLEDENGIACGTKTVFTFELDEHFFE